MFSHVEIHVCYLLLVPSIRNISCCLSNTSLSHLPCTLDSVFQSHFVVVFTQMELQVDRGIKRDHSNLSFRSTDMKAGNQSLDKTQHGREIGPPHTTGSVENEKNVCRLCSITNYKVTLIKNQNKKWL